MSKESCDYEIESYEDYWGEAAEVKKAISECPGCGSKLVFSHLPDYRNLYIQETARCIECDTRPLKKLHKIN